MNPNEAFEKCYSETALHIDNVKGFSKKIWDGAIAYAEGCARTKKQYYPLGLEPKANCLSCAKNEYCELPMDCQGNQYEPQIYRE